MAKIKKPKLEDYLKQSKGQGVGSPDGHHIGVVTHTPQVQEPSKG